MTGPMRGRRAARRSCVIHGDNGCDIQGEVSAVSRALEKRRWRREDQAYYWTPEWQADEQAAMAELARGEGHEFDSAAAMIAWLTANEETSP